jgi:hypothetical protein
MRYTGIVRHDVVEEHGEHAANDEENHPGEPIALDHAVAVHRASSLVLLLLFTKVLD